ncbi:hypothetical protein EB809_03910 [Marinobacter sp. R17]|nr:hypothetical protein EB809_03910 [Marinobacter sp. R17]
MIHSLVFLLVLLLIFINLQNPIQNNTVLVTAPDQASILALHNFTMAILLLTNIRTESIGKVLVDRAAEALLWIVW